MKQVTKNKILPRGVLMCILCTCMYLSLVGFAFAQGMQYKPLVGIPGLEDTTNPSLSDFINKVYIALISLGAMLGVLRIAWAGVKYSLSDVVTDKSSALGTIKGVLLGLAILLLPYLVLNEINPNLTRLDVINFKMKVGSDSSIRPYLENDLETVGRTIEKNAVKGASTTFPYGNGSDQEFENMKSQCKVNYPGAMGVRDTVSKTYTCIKF